MRSKRNRWYLYIFARLNSSCIQALYPVQKSKQGLGRMGRADGESWLSAIVLISSVCSRLEAPWRGGEHDPRAPGSHPVHVCALRGLSE